ncbi:MAG: protease complex subunit PrcB family protein [Azospirillaceae bacterium]|nr:protease complex subunit PrcB family protein [Azospirillaceae bacterium]
MAIKDYSIDCGAVADLTATRACAPRRGLTPAGGAAGFATRWRLLALCAVLTLGIAGCGDVAALLAGDPLPQEGVTAPGYRPGIDGVLEWSGSNSTVQVHLTEVARQQDEWQQIWAHVGKPAPGPLPSGWTAIAVFVGTRSTPGAAVRISNIDSGDVLSFGESLKVYYAESSAPVDPNAKTPATQLSTPYIVKLIKAYSPRIDVLRQE